MECAFRFRLPTSGSLESCTVVTMHEILQLSVFVHERFQSSLVFRENSAELCRTTGRHYQIWPMEAEPRPPAPSIAVKITVRRNIPNIRTWNTSSVGSSECLPVDISRSLVVFVGGALQRHPTLNFRCVVHCKESIPKLHFFKVFLTCAIIPWCNHVSSPLSSWMPIEGWKQNV